MAGLSKDSLETVATTEHSRAELLESSKLSGATGGSEAGTKRKEHPKSTGKRFKALGNVVLAMRRFQGGPWRRHCSAAAKESLGPAALPSLMQHWQPHYHLPSHHELSGFFRVAAVDFPKSA